MAHTAEKVEPESGSHEALPHEHADVLRRLRRASGHLQNVVSMIEAGRECVEIAQQMQAVIRALESAKTVLIHDHIEHCLESAMGPMTRDQRGAVRQFKEIAKYL